MSDPTRPILFLDSGVGGLPYLEDARRRIPGHRLVYVADRSNFPYGRKSREELCDILTALVERALERIDPALVVVACNTASVSSLEALRRRFALPFVGVVPAIKLAALSIPTGRIAILATAHTATTNYLNSLIHCFAAGRAVSLIAADGLVELVERSWFETMDRDRAPALLNTVEALRRERIDTIVLGCTHFLFLREMLAHCFGGAVRLLDSREGVSHQIVRVLNRIGQEGGEAAVESRPRLREDTLFLTGPAPPEDRYRLFAKQFGLRLMGSL